MRAVAVKRLLSTINLRKTIEVPIKHLPIGIIWERYDVEMNKLTLEKLAQEYVKQCGVEDIINSRLWSLLEFVIENQQVSIVDIIQLGELESLHRLVINSNASVRNIALAGINEYIERYFCNIAEADMLTSALGAYLVIRYGAMNAQDSAQSALIMRQYMGIDIDLDEVQYQVCREKWKRCIGQMLRTAPQQEDVATLVKALGYLYAAEKAYNSEDEMLPSKPLVLMDWFMPIMLRCDIDVPAAWRKLHLDLIKEEIIRYAAILYNTEIPIELQHQAAEVMKKMSATIDRQLITNLANAAVAGGPLPESSMSCQEVILNLNDLLNKRNQAQYVCFGLGKGGIGI